jgi:hypothetical protein
LEPVLPTQTTLQGTERVFIEDDFDYLTAPNLEITAQPKTFFRGIEDEAGESLLVAV